MIYEYALEPELVVTWGDPAYYGHFIDQFGFDRQGRSTGRVVAQYPEDWKEIVSDTLRKTPLTPIQKTRIAELLRYITQKKNNQRSYVLSLYFGTRKKSWLENAKEEKHSPSFSRDSCLQ